MCEHGARVMKMGVHLVSNILTYLSMLEEEEQTAIKLRYNDDHMIWFRENASVPEQPHYRMYRQMLLDDMPEDCENYFNLVMKKELEDND